MNLRTRLLLDVLDLHCPDVHDLAAFIAFGEDALSFLTSYLEVFSFAPGTGELPVVFVFFGYHIQYIDLCLLNGNVA